MKILAVSDQIVDGLYSPAVGAQFNGMSLLVGCGDLDYSYLEFLLTMLNIPLYYVPGNHDPLYNRNQAGAHVEGGLNIDRMVVRTKGLTVAGLGGCIRYRPDGINQYTQEEMYGRLIALFPGLLWNLIRHGRALDILVTHSPPDGIHDDDDPPHRGLRAINWLIGWAKPRYVLHGHVHIYRRNLVSMNTLIGHTSVINVYPYRVIQVDDE
jgi:Icc-related predicted phosphoesterase